MKIALSWVLCIIEAILVVFPITLTLWVWFLKFVTALPNVSTLWPFYAVFVGIAFLIIGVTIGER